ncbi:hypothetical protein ACFWDI_24550 [Streptomyces sp. NPDC060064]|uniref:hypothetical protein n=1 Tax=Streptomyces sp. NPDC060064 TaxID=3347049 RepID=UPI0036C00A28
MYAHAPLPSVDLTDSQWHLLAQLLSGPLPEPGSSADAEEAVSARGLDVDQARADVPSLVWLKFVEHLDGLLVITDLGAAMHYRSQYESSERLLSEIALLAEANETMAPEFARTVRRLAQGALSVAEAPDGVRRRPV